ncbi:MAG: ATP-grasp domain-containing protein, partial [Desulfobulbaceae bacterium]|nr:ATP-grasp domain-containing protein [Desulfobulbaceae bacterium]
VKKGEKPEGIALNLAYGIQGNSRYTHVPSILEMAGIPYTGSAPLAHSVSLDKEMTKRILLQSGIATPRFVLLDKKLDQKDAEQFELTYPLIIKPENEAASFGISVVDSPEKLVEAVDRTLDEFHQPLLIEEFLCGREFNVGVLGNGSALEVFDPVEIEFTESGYCFQSFDGKKNGSYRHICPADIPDTLKNELKEIARKTFQALKCNDYARIDFRLDQDMRPYVLELNSMAAVHQNGSFFHAARNAGYDYSSMLDKIIEVATARYNLYMEI